MDVTFTAGERAEIRDYYAGHRPPSAESLPPGIRRRLARGKRLPPGIAKQMLPDQLESRLPHRDGYERVRVGLDVFLVEVATGVIHDVLSDVVGRL